MPRIPQGAFNSGVLAPGLYGRVDLDRYSSALRVGRNVIPLPEGGLIRRPPLEFIGYANGSAARLIPFKFNNEQTYMMVAEDDRIRVIKDGGFVLVALPMTPTGYSFAGSVVIVGHGVTTALPNGTPLYWETGGPEEMHGRWGVSANSNTATFEFQDYVTGAIDSTGFSNPGGAPTIYQIFEIDENTSPDGWFDDGTGTSTMVDPDVSELDYEQSNDVLFVAHPDGPAKEVVRGASDTAWTVTNFDPAPSQASPGALTFTVAAGAAGSATIQYAVTAIKTSDNSFEESIATLDEATSVDPDAVNPTDTVLIEWSHLTGADKYRIYKGVGGIYGLIGTAEGTTGTISFTDTGIVANLTIAPPLETNYFGAADDYPGAVGLFQQRIWFGRTNTLLRDVYASKSGSLSSFATSTLSVDDDPISQTIVARSVQEVRYFVPLRDLVVLTSDGEWGFDKGDSGAINPSSGLIAQSFWGSRQVKPIIVGGSALFVERTGRSVRDLAYALQNDGFSSSNLSIFAKHYFQNREVVGMCFAETPLQVLFCVMSDGRALSCTYVADQQIFAWAEHDTGGYMLDCAAVTEGEQDNIYVAIRRYDSDGGNSHVAIERMQTNIPEFGERAVYLDNAVVDNEHTDGAITIRDPRIVDGKLQMALNDSTVSDGDIVRVAFVLDYLKRLDGLSFIVDDSATIDQTGAAPLHSWFNLYRHVDGDTTSRELFEWQDYLPDTSPGFSTIGLALAARTKTTGLHNLSYRTGFVTARLDNTDAEVTVEEGIYTAASAKSTIHFGEPFISEIETLDIDSAQNPVTGAPMQIASAYVRFAASNGYQIGRDRSSLATVSQADLLMLDGFDIQKGWFDGVSDILNFPSWRLPGRLIVRTSSSFPMSILTVVPVAEVGDLSE